MTPRPRLVSNSAVPGLLALSACALALAVALALPADPALLACLIVAAVLAVTAALMSVRTALRRQAALTQSEEVAATHAQLVDDLFATDTATLLATTDLAGHITRFNPGAVALTGVPADQALGRSPAFFLDDAALAAWSLAMRTEHDFGPVAARLVASDQAQPMEWPYLRPDGERRLLSLAICPLLGDAAVLVGYLLAGHDVTDDESSPNGTEQFLSTMSLELRAPMASILGYAEMLAEELDGTPEADAAQGFVERIERNGQRMLLLIQDLLTLTRVEEPDLELRHDRVDLRNLVQTAYDELLSRIADRRLDVSLRLPPDPVPQVCDAHLVEQAVLHLVANAAKFTPDGGRIVVSVKTGEQGNRVVIGDTGLGISQTDRERLFTRFFRSHQAEVQQLQGSGLGLAIVAAVAEVHGGTVSVESELGRGSTFVVALPHQGGSEPAPACAPAVAAPPSPSMSA